MAGLSTSRLAELAGLPDSAIANIESGAADPACAVAPLSVPELKLRGVGSAWEAAETDPNFALNCWLAPGLTRSK